MVCAFRRYLHELRPPTVYSTNLVNHHQRMKRTVMTSSMTNHKTRSALQVMTMATLIAIAISSVSAQQSQPKKDPSSLEQTQFAPGVVTVIPPAPDPKETYTGPITLQTFLNEHPELVWGAPDFENGEPHFDPRTRTIVEMAKQVILRREIYCLEFSFKPLRQIYVDLPQPDGRLQRKLIWYMVYRVRYRGGDLRPAPDKFGGADVFKRVEAVGYDSRRFFPILYLTNVTTGRKYIDRILPSAKQKIAIREQIKAPLHNSVEISRIKIPRSSDKDAPGIWGVVTWEDIDPQIDFLSVSVLGLTNAFEQDGEGDAAPYRRKALQLHFFRPGDSMNQTADLIRFGVPAFKNPKEMTYILNQYKLNERLDYKWSFLSSKE